jgi:hypothetical protein
MVKDRFGNNNSAYYLHGDPGSYLNLGTSDAIKPKQGSLSLWVNVQHIMHNGKGVELNPIFYTRSHANEDFNEALIIDYNISTKNISVGTAVSQQKQVSLYSNEVTSMRDWHHVVVTFDTTRLEFYLDGKLNAKVPRNFESEYLKGDSVIIGNMFTNSNKRFFNGYVDDIEIYNTVLSGQQVQELFQAPNPNKNAIIIKWTILIFAIIIIVVLIICLIKSRIKKLVFKENERNKLIHHALEQEIKVLKAQMDPHFIFNSLNTILQFIVVKENEKAELYLTKFSKLIRKMLESNMNESIRLSDELDILKKYLEIESLRFDTQFSPVIEIDKAIDPAHTYISHMLIQPFVENAIWHGLLLKKGDKNLSIKFELINEKTLLCIVDDNGVGRNKVASAKLLNKNKPLAINFIKQRLELLSKMHNQSYSVEIIDKVTEKNEREGTRVEIKIPILKKNYAEGNNN